MTSNYTCVSVETTERLCEGENSRARLVVKLDISRLTVVSREAKKKQHACASSGPRDHYSELFTWMAALNF